MADEVWSDARLRREAELFEKFQREGLTAEERAEVERSEGVGAEWSSAQRNAYIEGSENPWFASLHWDNVIEPASEIQAAEHAGIEAEIAEAEAQPAEVSQGGRVREPISQADSESVQAQPHGQAQAQTQIEAEP